jgi:hypothetical protein
MSKQMCAQCDGDHAKRKTFLHESGQWLCRIHLVRRALGSRQDFRSEEAMTESPKGSGQPPLSAPEKDDG